LLRAGIQSDYVDIDPHHTKGGGIIQIHRSMSETTLTRWLPDEQELHPNLAESWEWTNDNTTIVFHLRQGVKFHDGSEVTTEAVKFSYERQLDPELLVAASEAIERLQAATIEYPDDYTVSFTSESPYANAPVDFGGVGIISPDWTPENPISAGPFVFESWERNTVIKYRRFEDYWEEGLPLLERVELYPTPDEEVRYLRLVAGELDFIDAAPLTRVKDILANPDLQLFRPVNTGGWLWIIPNMLYEPLGDYRVRQAMNWAIDREGLVELLDGVPMKWSRLTPESPYFNPEAIRYDHQDLDAAKALMAEAGLADGFDVELLLVGDLLMIPTIAQWLQANWAEIGINVTITLTEPGNFHDRLLSKKDFQLAFTGNGAPNRPESMYPSIEGIVKNYSGYVAPDFPESQEIWDAIAAGLESFTEEERLAAWQKVHELEMKYVPDFTISSHTYTHAATARLQNYEMYSGRLLPAFTWCSLAPA
jgi:peptide/nickel transport system substrate-binding protein